MYVGKNNSSPRPMQCCMSITQSRGHVERDVKRGSKTDSKAGTARHPARHHRNSPMIALGRLFSYKTVSTVASSRVLLEK